MFCFGFDSSYHAQLSNENLPYINLESILLTVQMSLPINYLPYVHGNGKFAIWNCGLKWIIGKAEDMPNCLSWAESDYESKVTRINQV